MSSAPVDVIIQNYPNAMEIPWTAEMVSNAFFLDKQTKQLVDPDGGVSLYIHDINETSTTVSDPTLTKLAVGARQWFIPQQAQPGKLKLTWQAFDNVMNIIGSGQSILNLVPTTI